LATATVKGDLNVSGIPLADFTGLPRRVSGDILAQNCGARSLRGLPRKIAGDLDLSGNNLIDMTEGPREVTGQIRIGSNPLMTFEGHPEKFGMIKLDEFEYYLPGNLPERPRQAEPRPAANSSAGGSPGGG